MKVCYHDNFNFDVGILGGLHPFDGTKFRKVYKQIKDDPKIEIITPTAPIGQAQIEEFVDPLIKRLLKSKEPLLRALEFPNLPFLTHSFIDKKVLTPMRWGVAGTISAAEEALSSGFCWNLSGGYHHASQHSIESFCWNLSGGYHHASQHSIESFCIYNDIGIAYQELLKKQLIREQDRILIIDTEAHHGNGNAVSFMENRQVHILDVYNQDLYPTTRSTRDRVNISVPLKTGVSGSAYLESYKAALQKVKGDYALAFVVAGTDVLINDKLGGMALSIDDVLHREKLTAEVLSARGIPTVFLSGGGYSNASSDAIAESIIGLK